jgi:hypothetical protein
MTGRPPTLKDYDEVMNATRRQFRLPTAPSTPPSEETRRKFSGGGLGGASGTSNSREYPMNEADMKMAEAAFKRIRDPKTGQIRKATKAESHAMWAQKVGKKILDSRKAG